MQLAVTYQSPATRWDTSIDERGGRPLLGFVGKGTVELGNGVLRVHARRHRYMANLIGGGVIGGALSIGWAVLSLRQSHKADFSDIPMFFLFAFLLGAFLTSVVFRFSSPQEAAVPFSNVERIKVVGGSVRIFCKTGGDVQLTTRHKSEVQSFLGWCASAGLPVVW